MNELAWVLQVLLAFVFLAHGLLYTVAYGAVAQRRRASGDEVARLDPTFRKVVGVAEVAAAFGLILPDLTGILPWLTPVAAAGLVVVMAGAVVYHARRGEPVVSAVVLLVLAVAAVTLRAWIAPFGVA